MCRLHGRINRGVRVVRGELTWAAGCVGVGEVAGADGAARSRGPVLCRRRRTTPLLVPPQTQQQQQCAQCTCAPPTGPFFRVLRLDLLRGAPALACRGPRGVACEPAVVRVARRVAVAAAARVALFFDDDRLAIAAAAALFLGAETEEGQRAVPQTAHDAAGTDGEQDDNTGQDADDDAGNGATAEGGAARAVGDCCAVAGARSGGAFDGACAGGGGAGAGDAVGGAELGGDGAAGGGDGGGDHGPCGGDSSAGAAAGYSSTLAGVGAGLIARATNRAAVGLTQIQFRHAGPGSGGGGGGGTGAPVGGASGCVGGGEGESRGVERPAVVLSRVDGGYLNAGGHGHSGTCSNTVRGLADLVGGAAVLILDTAVGGAERVLQEAGVEGIVQVIFGEWICECRLYEAGYGEQRGYGRRRTVPWAC